MPDLSSLPPAEDNTAPDLLLTERVITRIKDARRDIQVRSRTDRAKGRSRRTTDGDASAMRRVFLDLGKSYRSYRRRTGQPVEPQVRDAALRFRRELDLRSLVSVAASLERLDGTLLG